MGSAADVRVICRRSDIPPKKRRATQEALRLLYYQNVKKREGDKKRTRSTCLAEFAQSLKESLDSSFGFHWHVIVGNQVGFACKKRDKTMGMWNVEDSLTVVVWQSPGIEVLESPHSSEATADPSTPDADSGSVRESDGEGNKATVQGPCADANKEQSKSSSTKFRILQPSTIEDGSTVDQTIAVLKEELLKSPLEDDVQILAQTLRTALTAKMGPIWHVIVGEDFVVEAASNRRSFVLVAMGKMRVVCFQHEQKTGGSTVDWDRVFRSLPYLALALFCAAYMALQYLCGDSTPPTGAWLAWTYSKGCYDGWKSDMNMVGALTVGGLFLYRKTRIFTSREK
mmetsp:Transcript_126255/g.252203  ORF Transcript_126255/g.252203 Transcript_126255/m.252203 type:complete len:341 (+) Transcript_126255:98-1120(+)